MAASLTIPLQCSVCENLLKDPVDLPCSHTFCQQCLQDLRPSSSGQRLCPDCSEPFDLKDLKPNTLLRNLMKVGKEDLTKMAAAAATKDPRRGSTGDPAHDKRRVSKELEQDFSCDEHDEKLKLFCETDQKLICVICRDCASHRGHSFKPLKEVASGYMEQLKQAHEFVCRDNSDVEFLLKLQRTEESKTQERSRSLRAEISDQFEQLHQALRKKETEMKRLLDVEEKRAMEGIKRSSAVIEERLREGRRQEEVLQGALLLQQAHQLLQWWSEKGSSLIEGLRLSSPENPLGSQPPAEYKSRVKGLSLTPESLDLGPYESHLSFFVWKEMLSSIKPVPDRLTVRDPKDRRLKISLGGSSVRQTDQQDAVNKDFNPTVVTLETFQTGRHYWEVEVGEKLDWGVGVGVSDPQFPYVTESIMLLLRHDKGYCVREFKSLVPIEVKTKPRRVGVYLDCERKLVYFYDASTMDLLYASRRSFARVLCVCVCPGLYLNGHNSAPLTLCWY